jgi:cytochrome c oxidase assembly factor CtaG
MFPVLDDSIIDIGRRHVPAVYVMQDLGSAIGLAVVVAFVLYALRRGAQSRVPDRLVPHTERLRWILIYIATAIALSAGSYLWAHFGQPASRSIVGRAYEVAIASLRGLAAALLCVSLALQLRLRALRYRSSGPER